MDERRDTAADPASAGADPERPVVFTIGHSTRGADEFVELVEAHGVQVVVDVRRFPGSRRHPHFGREALEKTLTTAGIAYAHLVELGGRRGKPDSSSPNDGWRIAAFQAYADRMAAPEWLAALNQLEERAREEVVAFMCSEAVPWRCHRRLISDALVVRGLEVRHILGLGRADSHQLPEFARVLSDRRIIYPAPEEGRGGEEQGELSLEDEDTRTDS